ncbi:MAG: O-antigen ligase family protein [Bdellovibrionota bacterium]
MTQSASPLTLPATIAAALIPIKLSLTYIALIPSLLVFAYQERGAVQEIWHRYRSVLIPIAFFLFCILYSSFFGLNTGRSLSKGMSLAGMFLIIPLYAYLCEQNLTRTILLALVIGFSLESLHSIFEGAFPTLLFPYPHGAVSEAGQLGMALFVALALCTSPISQQRSTHPLAKTLLIGGGTFFLLTFLGLSHLLELPFPVIASLTGVVLVILSWHLFHLFRSRHTPQLETRTYRLLSECIVPLICAALIVNMKRGPWIGVTVGLTVLLLTMRPRLLFGILPLIIAIFLLDPIRTRVTASLEHFLMVGGRGEIWQLGGELLARYPLGIGLQNSRLIEQFSYDIPSNMNHFHSNLINIVVELGWLGLFSYLWWIGSVLFLAFSWYKTSHLNDTRSEIPFVLGCGILSWQVAGLFEYNFGDSEVFIIALILSGIVVGNTLGVTQTSRLKTHEQERVCSEFRQ